MSETKVEKNNDSDFSHDGGHSLHFYRDGTLVLRMQLHINAKEAGKKQKHSLSQKLETEPWSSAAGRGEAKWLNGKEELEMDVKLSSRRMQYYHMKNWAHVVVSQVLWSFNHLHPSFVQYNFFLWLFCSIESLSLESTLTYCSWVFHF